MLCAVDTQFTGNTMQAIRQQKHASVKVSGELAQAKLVGSQLRGNRLGSSRCFDLNHMICGPLLHDARA